MTDQMPRAIAQLQLDHRNMTRLLDLLRRELDAYRAGQALDVDLLGSIMEYSLHYPDLCHHPLENLIYEKLVQRDPAAGAKVGDLLKEHAHLGELARKLAAAISNVARDSELPRAWLEEVIDAYLGSNYRHIEGEEKIFFPLAVSALTEADWAAIESTKPNQADPLFGGKITQSYRTLYERIMPPAA
ncbi:hemerythrin domain-containing protein [Dongia sp.]|jgi:hemerythrin-like domain-containing protein|uniref:hemerythrin domain-containing protein n=1 Tax=Dongia sp. TaxID=1977262 RepID=UPI0034A36D12